MNDWPSGGRRWRARFVLAATQSAVALRPASRSSSPVNNDADLAAGDGPSSSEQYNPDVPRQLRSRGGLSNPPGMVGVKSE